MNTQGTYVILYREIPTGWSVCGISPDASVNSPTSAQVVTYVRLVGVPLTNVSPVPSSGQDQLPPSSQASRYALTRPRASGRLRSDQIH
jgi:hypothetical protein